MSFLRKRRKKYYICFTKTIDGETREIVRTLKTGNREFAEKRQEELDGTVKNGEDPFHPEFDFAPWEARKTWYSVQECYEDFLESRKKYRFYTWKSYKDIIGKFVRHGRLSDKSIENLTDWHFEHFLMRDGIKDVTRHSEKRKLKTWWNWLIKKGRIEDDLISDIELPQEDVEYFPKMISKKELEKVFAAFRKHAEWRRKQDWFRGFHEQHWFIPAMAVFFYSGFRRSEVGTDSQIEHSGLKGINILHTGKKIDFIYISKAKVNRERFVPVSFELEKYLLEYFEIRGWPEPDEYVFINKKGKPVTGRNMLDVFKEYCKKAGVPQSRTIHGMRHSRGTLWLEMGFL